MPNVPVFTCPTDEWLPLDVHDPHGPRQTAQSVADRGGRRAKRYAKDLLPELLELWESAQPRRIGPYAVHVPHQRPKGRLDVPTVYSEWHRAPHGGPTMDAVIASVSESTKDASRPGRDITTVQLPAGPACRVYYELIVHYNPRLTAHAAFLTYYLLPENGVAPLLALHASWNAATATPGLQQAVDHIAATLTLQPRTPDLLYGQSRPAAEPL
ncbi:hypothetical protein [Streptomyces sp. NBC_01803]|uniref:hypothetical protein n=1 Tax=Streptomyces sp. NBC_01803 TaxID=2975946 RepID=UPI002DDBA1BA|nr:hypothetical protein [Streptomyces sp. NBC_01803]WSA42760.1 hypothetical protein OIE51_00170 [Streptomyces sp. NBC_01803]